MDDVLYGEGFRRLSRVSGRIGFSALAKTLLVAKIVPELA